MTFFEKWKNSFEISGKLPTAYLFSGPEGSGRCEAALKIATTLLGRTKNHPDFLHITPDLKTPKSTQRSLRIEAIRELIKRLSLKPFEGDRIVSLIEETELMTVEAANALLKTLEEPPPHVLFILTTTAADKLPPTVRSRCQKVSFQVETVSLRGRLQNTLSLWRETLEKLFQTTHRPFVQASSIAASVIDSVTGEPEKLPGFFELLQCLWRDGIVFLQTGNHATAILPESRSLIERHLEHRSEGQLLEEIDWIEDTKRAIEGNVNKTLALEHLFMKLIA